MTDDPIRWQGHHLAVREQQGWEYATRPHARGVVAIVALTEADELVLVEQHRRPVGARVVELPAGLVGDVPGAEAEGSLAGARRELLEETGYVATRWLLVADGPSSAGMCDERVDLWLARGLEQVGPGGGDATEDITVHRVALTEVSAWLASRRREGVLIDHKVLAALYLLQTSWDGRCWVAP
ncbi:MAG: NUDIX hydrolase [Alphaproteobacteria bacterium]|nr:NUDIX hydrolase [Alphaproteobacteria bacterium]